MAKLTEEEVKHIAKLSRLELKDREIDKYSDQLSSVLSYIDKLGEVGTEGIAPCANITGLENIMRSDEVESSGITYKDIAQNAPEFKDGYFVVPGVFE